MPDTDFEDHRNLSELGLVSMFPCPLRALRTVDGDSVRPARRVSMPSTGFVGRVPVGHLG